MKIQGIAPNKWFIESTQGREMTLRVDDDGIVQSMAISISGTAICHLESDKLPYRLLDKLVLLYKQAWLGSFEKDVCTILIDHLHPILEAFHEETRFRSYMVRESEPNKRNDVFYPACFIDGSFVYVVNGYGHTLEKSGDQKTIIIKRTKSDIDITRVINHSTVTWSPEEPIGPVDWTVICKAFEL